jgi:hypothetical protein
MLRWLATVALALLFVLNLWMPSSPLGRRGTERIVRAHVPAAAGWVGQKLPDLAFEDLYGRVVSTADLLGHPLLLVFERSVDW